MTKERVFELILESLKLLKESGKLEAGIILGYETALLGKESPLDSIGFVTFVTDLEERIAQETKKDLYIVLDQISEFNINNPKLSIDVLTQYIMKLANDY